MSRRLGWWLVGGLLWVGGCGNLEPPGEIPEMVPRIPVSLVQLAAGLSFPLGVDIIQEGELPETGLPRAPCPGHVLVAQAGRSGSRASSVVLVNPLDGMVQTFSDPDAVDLFGEPGVDEPRGVRAGSGYVWTANRAAGRGSLAALDVWPGEGWDGPNHRIGEPVDGPLGGGVFGGDALGLQVVSIHPEDGAENVPLDVVVAVRFSQPLDRAEVRESRFSLSPATDGCLEVDADDRGLRFLPDEPLDSDREYRVKLSHALKDIYGHSLDGDPRSPGSDDFESSFSTLRDPFFVTGTDPACGASDVPAELDRVVVTFNKQVRESSVSRSKLKLISPEGDALGGELQVHEDLLSVRLLIDPDERPLHGDGIHTILVSHELSARDGTPLDQRPGGWPDSFCCSFHTGIPDESPAVVLTEPAHGETGVDLSPDVLVIFSEEVRVPAGGVVLLDALGSEIPLDPRSSEEYQAAHAWSCPLLERSCIYVLHVTQACHDRDGNALSEPVSASFSTEEHSNPQVTGVSPPDGALGIPLDTDVAVNFSETVDCETVTASSFALIRSLEGTQVPSALHCHGEYAELVPEEDLEPGESYRIQVTTEVTDLDGFCLDQVPGGELDAFESSFVTVEGPDPDPPAVVECHPPDGAEDVFVGTQVRVRFSEPMEPDGFDAASFVLEGPGGPVAATRSLEDGDLTAVLLPDCLLEERATHVLRVSGSVRDSQGQEMGVDWVSTFVTGHGRVLINEVVTDPQQDWNDDESPFDAVPGDGAATATDEWIELVNASSGVVDLQGWRLRMHDTTPEEHEIGSGQGASEHFFGSSFSHPGSFHPGDYLVLGNPTGAINNDIYLELLDASGKQVDDVELGDDPEGDGEGDGAPDGNATDVADEAVARMPDGVDSDQDPLDWHQQAATLGSSNGGIGGGRGRSPTVGTGSQEQGLCGIVLAGPAPDEAAPGSILAFTCAPDQGRVLYLDFDDGIGVLVEGFTLPVDLAWAPGEEPGRGTLWILDRGRAALARLRVAPSGPTGSRGVIPIRDEQNAPSLQFFTYPELGDPVALSRSDRSGHLFVGSRGSGQVLELDARGERIRIYETGLGAGQIGALDVGILGREEQLVLAVTGGPGVGPESGPQGWLAAFRTD